MDHLLLDQFLNEYWNIETNIGEGCANAIATTWYRQFQNFLEIMSFENILGPICNQALIQPLTELMFEPQGYNISETYVCSEEKAYKLRHDACINEDYIVVSQTMWKFLDKYFKADYEIVLFVTKQPLEQQMFVQCENLNPGLCIPLKQIDLLIAVMSPMENTRFQIIHTPMSVLVSLDHFQQFVNDITMSKCCFQVDSKFFLYIDKKRVPLKGHRTLEKVGIKHTMQIVIAIQNLLLEDFEEERETDGEEMIEIEIADNLEERQEFVQKVEQAMSDIHYNLNIKSIEEIKQNLCQIECVYFSQTKL